MKDENGLRIEVVGLTPKLRFPDFRHAPKWRKKKLSDLAKIVRGGSPRPIEAFLTKEPNGLNWLKIGDVPRASKYILGTEQRVLPSALSKTREVLPGDLILSNSMSFGRPYISGIRACIHDGWIAITKISGFVENEFLYYSVLVDSSQEYFENQAAGGGVRNLNVEIVDSLPISVPETPEQLKIVECMSSLDDLIFSEARKLDMLKDHQKAMVQGLFPRDGDSFPKLRFIEFRSAPDWKEQKVSGLLRRVSNPVDVQPDAEYGQIGIRSHGRGIFHKEPVSGESLGDKRVFWVQPDAFVVNIVFAWEQAVANTSASEAGMVASHRFPMYVPRDDLSDVRFLKCFFLTGKGKELLWLASPGGAGRNKTLGQKEFENLKLTVPERREEQSKIADFLASLDNLIALQSRKIDLLKDHKKGLMQGVFPSDEDAAE